MIVFLFFYLMIRPPPKVTPTCTLLPYTTLFRSCLPDAPPARNYTLLVPSLVKAQPQGATRQSGCHRPARPADSENSRVRRVAVDRLGVEGLLGFLELQRSEERRVGKECVSTCRSRWSP